MISRLDHINIVVSNLDRAKAFFFQFGFVEKDSAELSGAWISAITGLAGVQAKYVALTLPGSRISLELIEYMSPKSGCDPGVSLANQIGFRHLAFAVEDIDREVARLAENGVAFIGDVGVYQKTGKKLVYFKGPDGILLELAQYPEE